MGRRIEVNREALAIAVPGEVLHELFAHARETAPEECCGLVIGDARERFRRVVRCRNEMTRLHQQDSATHARDGREGYFMNPYEYQTAMEDAEARGEHVTAIYHSHVNARVYLSELDLEYAEGELFPFPDAAQIVIGVVRPSQLTEFRALEAALFERETGRDPWLDGRTLAAAGA